MSTKGIVDNVEGSGFFFAEMKSDSVIILFLENLNLSLYLRYVLLWFGIGVFYSEI